MDEGNRIFVGLDVHKDTIAAAAAEAGSGEARYVCTFPHDVPKLLKLLKGYGEAGSVRVVYEAGPTGYGLYRELCAKGYECQVVA